jgi:CubicO group peptidase (beta-lactamase class C family)
VSFASGRLPLSEATFVSVDAVLEDAVSSGIGSAAVLRIDDLERGRLLREWVVGTVSREPSGPGVTSETAFDLASLTKLYTATLTLRLVARGFLALETCLADLVPPLRRSPLHLVTVGQLLEHTSGAVGWKPLFEKQSGSRAVRDAAAALAADKPGPGLYSDIGFLVLQTVLEHMTRTPFGDLLVEEVLEPIGELADLPTPSFRSVGAGPEAVKETIAAGQIVATENCPRRGLLCGEVHDGNAWAMGGVAPHAGLFGSAATVAALARSWWTAPRSRFLPRSIRDAAWARPRGEGTHVLGWDTVSPGGSSAGTMLSRRSVGHLGFTGTSLWIDPDRRISIVLLTNRVHPSRDDDRIRALRPTVHDAAAAFVDGGRSVR